jgi:hypothetical protein
MRAEAFLHSGGRRRAAWVFYAASPEEADAAQKALGVAPIAGHYFLVSLVGAPRLLIAEGLVLRRQWKQAVPFNKRVDELIQSDKQLLAGTCVPYGELGDPDISPHWPPVKTTHQ